jgi:hypothetical protein
VAKKEPAATVRERLKMTRRCRTLLSDAGKAHARRRLHAAGANVTFSREWIFQLHPNSASKNMLSSKYPTLIWDKILPIGIPLIEIRRSPYRFDLNAVIVELTNQNFNWRVLCANEAKTPVFITRRKI